jgi:Gpi18-like mannosyltransferase
MAVIKKHIFNISLLFILLASGILCAYTLAHYQGSVTPAQNNNESRIQQQGELNGTSDIPVQTTGNVSKISGDADQISASQFPGQDVSQSTAPSIGRGFEGIGSAGSKYAPYLLTYALLFLDVIIAAYYFMLRKKIKIDSGHENILMLALLGFGLLLRVAAATLVDGQNDINVFKGWASAAANNFLQIYDGGWSIGYPPLYIYVLYLVGKIAAIPALSTYYMILLKLPSIMADIATAYLIYRLARKYLSQETSTLLSAFYAFNPAIFINSTFWGQVDSIFTLIIIAAVSLLAEKRTYSAAALFAAAVMMKPQGLIFLPVLFFELTRQKSLMSFMKAAAAALTTTMVIILPFSYNKGVLWIYEHFSKTTSENSYASVNAFNVFSLFNKNGVEDSAVLFGLSYYNWGMIFIVAVTIFMWFLYIRGQRREFAPFAALLLITGVFNMSTRMHERYLFPAVALTILTYIYFRDKRLLLLSAGFSATVYLNTHYVLFKVGGSYIYPYSPELIIISILNVLFFIYLCKVSYDIAVTGKIKPYDAV